MDAVSPSFAEDSRQKSYEDLLSCETQCTWREVAKRKEGGREEIERKNCKERFDSSPTYDLKIYWLSNRTAEGKKGKNRYTTQN